ncbi:MULTISPECIES: hypothetical protein [Nostoc]|nr:MULTISPECIES: hypothetical protein [Nostoc]
MQQKYDHRSYWLFRGTWQLKRDFNTYRWNKQQSFQELAAKF